MADVSKIKLPSGTTYNIKDTISGYTTNTGTITKVQTTAGAHTTINVTSGAAAFNVPTKTSHLTNDSGFLTNSTLYEANLHWGGKDFSAGYSPIDAAMIDVLGANRFAFLKAAGLTIEYSTNGGTSYTDYGATDAQKVGLFSSGQYFYLGKHTSNGSCTTNDRLRVTIDTGAASIYTVLNKIAIYMSTSGATVQVLIEKALQSTPTTFSTHKDWTGISGFSGWNILNISDLTTYGNTAASQYGRIRFTFRQTAVNTNYTSANISKIMGFGGVGWTVPSTMAATGHLYSYDSSQNATFPAKVTATSFSGPLTGNVTGNVSGTAANVTGTVAIANGGTGQTTAANAINALLNGLPVWTADPTDTTYFVRQDIGGSATYGKVAFSTIWNYISGKLPAWSKASTKPSYNFSEIGSTPTTLSGYGITDAKIASGVITLGSNTITPLTSSSTLSAAKLSGAIPSAVTATTQASTDNSTKIATTAFVQAAMSSAGAGTVTSVGISNGGGLSVSGSPVTSSGTITVSHADTSSQASSSNSGRTYIQSVTLDTYGHVTGLSTATETVTNTDEKLKVADASANTSYYPVLTADSTNAENKKYSKIFSFAVTSTYSYLTVGTPGRPGYLVFARSSDYKGYLTSASLTTGDAYWTLPAASGTIALTDDIPTIPSNIVTGTGSIDYLAKWSGTNTLSATSLSIGTSYNSNSDSYGTISLYVGSTGQINWKGQLVFLDGSSSKTITITPPSLTSSRTITLPDKTGTIALTSDIPSNNVTGSGSTNRLAIWSDTNTLSSNSSLSIGTSYNSSSDLYGKVKLYVGTTGQLDWQGQLVFYSGNTSKTITITPPSLATGSRTITLPDASGTVALTSDIPSITLNGSSTTSPSFYAPTDAGTSGYVLKSNGSGAPSWTSVVLTDENVKSTAVTAATTNYIVGSTTSTTTTGGLSKHASGVLYTTADSGTSGYTQLRLGNTTATSSAGGKEGQIRLYGTTATYYVDLKAGAPSANRTITLPNKTGTIALTDDIPTVPSNIVNTITTTAGAHTAITNQKGNVSFSIPTTAAHVGAAASDHTHGNITNGGDITATAPTIASGDQIIINDNSASKITNGPTFDGSTTTKALTQKGTWETFLKSYTETDPTVPSWAKASSKPSYNFSEIESQPTTISGYGITDAKIESGTITLGSNTITPLTNSSTLFYFSTFEASSYDFTSQQYRKLSKSITSRSGYTPIIIQVTCNNKSALHVFHYYLDGTTLYYEVYNRTSSSVSGASFVFKVLYIKSSLIGS